MGTLLVSLSAATLTALLIVRLHPAFSLLGEDWGRIAGIFVLSAVYLAAFFTLGLMVSVMVNRPATALALLLQVWIFLIVLYPNIAVDVSRQMASLPSEEEITYRKRATQERFQPRLQAIHEENQKGFSADVMTRWTEVMAEAAEAKHQIDVELSNACREQDRIAAMLLAISPASVYDRAATRLARTGMDQHDRFLDAAGRYWGEYIEASKARWRAMAARSQVKMPEFAFQSEGPAESLTAALPDVLVLALMSLIFLALSATLFLRKDVR
jgi:ABC-type transport system involved in multi-copper enzyme maturation permease subunit